MKYGKTRNSRHTPPKRLNRRFRPLRSSPFGPKAHLGTLGPLGTLEFVQIQKNTLENEENVESRKSGKAIRNTPRKAYKEPRARPFSNSISHTVHFCPQGSPEPPRVPAGIRVLLLRRSRFFGPRGPQRPQGSLGSPSANFRFDSLNCLVSLGLPEGSLGPLLVHFRLDFDLRRGS